MTADSKLDEMKRERLHWTEATDVTHDISPVTPNLGKKTIFY